MNISYVYMTEQGDTWDEIAYEQLGNEFFIDKLFLANPKLLGYLIFPEGIEVNIPDLSEEQSLDSSDIYTNIADDTESDDDSAYDGDLGDTEAIDNIEG